MIKIGYGILAVIFDLKFYKIPNVLCLCILITGILFSVFEFGTAGIFHMLFGIGIPLTLLFIFFFSHTLGAGDIKLLAALGAFYGKKVIYLTFLSFLFNAMIAVCKMLRHFSFQERFLYLNQYVKQCLMEGAVLPYESAEKDRIRFSIGILLSIITMELWHW